KGEEGPEGRHTLRAMVRLATIYQDDGRHADAVKLFEAVLPLQRKKLGVEHEETLWSTVCLPGSYLALSRYAEAVKASRQAAQAWEKLNRNDENHLYNAACIRAVLATALRKADNSPSAAKLADAEADRAMSWLKRAVAAGFKNSAHMKKDTDLDGL